MNGHALRELHEFLHQHQQPTIEVEAEVLPPLLPATTKKPRKKRRSMKNNGSKIMITVNYDVSENGNKKKGTVDLTVQFESIAQLIKEVTKAVTQAIEVEKEKKPAEEFASVS
jgi:hypothetical protein